MYVSGTTTMAMNIQLWLTTSKRTHHHDHHHCAIGIRQHSSTVYVGMVTVVCIRTMENKG